MSALVPVNVIIILKSGFLTSKGSNSVKWRNCSQRTFLLSATALYGSKIKEINVYNAKTKKFIKKIKF